MSLCENADNIRRNQERDPPAQFFEFLSLIQRKHLELWF